MMPSKIYIAGHTGLVGSSIVKALQLRGYDNFIYTPHSEYDLTNQQQTNEFFAKEKPDFVFLAAAKVGGINANNKYRAQFIYENLQIQNNIIHASYIHDVKKLLFLGSSCIYPKACPQPIKEDYLLTDELEYTNEPYAIAKIAGIKMCESYNIQYGTNFISVMPTNLYGANDNFDFDNSHVLPALMRKIHLAKCLMNDDFDAIRKDLMYNKTITTSKELSDWGIVQLLEKYNITSEYVKLWGDGSPRREFLHSSDLANACVFVMEHITFRDLIEGKTEIRNTHINIGVGEDISIAELAQKIKNIVDYKGEILWDKDKPNGTPRKLLNVDKLHNFGWAAKIGLTEGITKEYENYVTATSKI